MVEFSSWGQTILFDYHENLISQVAIHTIRERKPSFVTHEIAGIVWPEWWFHSDELTARAPLLTAQMLLGAQVLRMETAAIVGGRWLQQFN
jgi:16S rRNA U1498 N3-methylase RsmE